MANFSSVGRGHGFWKKSSWNESDDYMQKVSAQDENGSPVSETELGFSPRANALKNPQKVHVIEMECQLELKRQREHAQWGCFLGHKISARVEICHVIATIFQLVPSGWNLAWADIRHATTLLVYHKDFGRRRVT